MTQVRTGIRARSDKSPAVAWGREDCSARRSAIAGLGRQAYAGARGLRRSSVQEFDRPSLQAFLTLTDLHAHALTFCQPAEPAALKRRRMDENILPAPILSNEAKPLVGIVHFNRTDAFRSRLGTGLPLQR